MAKKQKKDTSVLDMLNSKLDKMNTVSEKNKQKPVNEVTDEYSTAIIAREGSTGCVLDTFQNITECIQVFKESYGISLAPAMLLKNLRNLTTTYKGYSFDFVTEVHSEYEDMRFAFVSAKSGKIVKTGTCYELAKEAGVTPDYICIRATKNEGDSPELLKRIPVMVMPVSGDKESNSANARQMWCRLMESTLRMFPTAIDTTGSIVCSFFSCAEACKAVRLVNNKTVLEKIKNACYTESSYLGYNWRLCPGKTYLEYAYVCEDEFTGDCLNTEDVEPEKFSTSTNVLKLINQLSSRD